MMMRMQMRPTFTAARTRVFQRFVPPPGYRPSPVRAAMLRTSNAKPPPAPIVTKGLMMMRSSNAAPPRVVAAPIVTKNVMRPAIFKSPTGRTKIDVPCWFEPGVNGSVTACCNKGDGTLICATLVDYPDK